MSYFSFLLKKVSKKKLTLVPLLFVSIFIVVIYFGRVNGIEYERSFDTKEVEGLKKNLAFSKEELASYDATSTQYKRLKADIEGAQYRIQLLENKKNAFSSKNWKAYYDVDIKLIDNSLERLKADQYYDGELISVLNINKKFAQYHVDHNLSFDDRFSSIQGFSFMVDIMNLYTPVILVFLLIFIVSNMYCESIVDGMQIHDVLPINRIKKQASKLMVGVSVGILALLYLNIFPMLCGAFANTLGNFQSPVLTFTMDKANTYISLSSILPQIILLSVLSIFFIVNFVSIISLITKRNLVCLILSLAILLGCMWVSTEIVPVSSITHLFPTTYFSVIKVISGELMNTVQNIHVNFGNGVIVLSIANVILFAIYYIGSKFSLKKVR